MLELEPQALGRGASRRAERPVAGLGEVHQPPVVPEVHRLELGAPVDAEPFEDQPVEVPREVVGEVEGARLRLVQGRERPAAGEELVAVGARDALRAFLREDRVEGAPPVPQSA